MLEADAGRKGAIYRRDSQRYIPMLRKWELCGYFIFKLPVFTRNKVENEFEILDHSCPGDAFIEDNGVGGGGCLGPLITLSHPWLACGWLSSQWSHPLTSHGWWTQVPSFGFWQHHFPPRSGPIPALSSSSCLQETWPCELRGETKLEIKDLLFHGAETSNTLEVSNGNCYKPGVARGRWAVC